MKKIDKILDEMLEKTRGIPADDRVPYAFEKRIMAHIHNIPETATLWEQWNRMLWRAVVPCVAVMVLVAVLLTPGEANGPASPGASAPTVATTEPAAEADLDSIVHHAIEAETEK